MKVSDFILDFLVSKGVKHVFLITGGVLTPLVDAFHDRTDIRYICTQHEQAAAMAADGYARFNGLGVAMATSGPGATNLITGIGCSYFDSIPVLLITGQVNTKEAKGASGVRQRGFQETDIISIVKPITKYTRYVGDPLDIQYALEAATWHAQEGRPGPVLLDIPINVQQAEIDPAHLSHFPIPQSIPRYLTGYAEATAELIRDAKRPVIVYGAGCRKAKHALLDLLDWSGIPCLPSWAGLDILPHDHKQFIGAFGVYGCRAGNLAVQNADLIIALGTRLDTRMTGAKGFAPKAHIVMVDVDAAEMAKIHPALSIVADTGDFLRELNQVDYTHYHTPRLDSWRKRIDKWKAKYPIVSSGDTTQIQPLDFVRALCAALPDDAIVTSDSGANLSFVHQAFTVRGTQRLFSAYGYSPMGYSLPAAIGAHFATGKPVVCLIGDGSMQMNIQELQTLAYYQIPVKVFVMNNHSYGIIKQFQEERLQGRYEATDAEHGYSVPDFVEVGESYKIESDILDEDNFYNMEDEIPDSIEYSRRPHIWNVIIDPAARITPKLLYPNSLENQTPLLPADELAENMEDDPA